MIVVSITLTQVSEADLQIPLLHDFLHILGPFCSFRNTLAVPSLLSNKNVSVKPNTETTHNVSHSSLVPKKEKPLTKVVGSHIYLNIEERGKLG